MNTIQAKQLGDKYILLDSLGIGGMAEVFRAKQLGKKGFAKQIVIKKLLPQAAHDKEMVRLFIGEAKLAAMLQHENIAATYDFGEIDGAYFLAMEYLSGVDLHSLMKKTRDLWKPLETQYALHIVAKICEGMDYAHRLKDFQNKPLNIIHRDLTPHNIFLTYDGKVKVFDFGVAKAEILDNKTQAGVVKGKLSYMSPEQIAGEKIDSRSDIFSIGILLYEMLSGKRMYEGDTATLIQKCLTVDYVPLREIYPNLPPELYAILDKALERDREERYQSCGQMQADIEDLMFSMGKRTDAKNMQNYVRGMFGEEYKKAQKQATLAMDERTTVAALSQQDKTVVMQTGVAEKTVLYDTEKEEKQEGLKGFDTSILKDKRVLIGGAGVLVLLLAAIIIPSLFKEDEVATSSSTQSLEMEHEPLSIDKKVSRLQKLAEKALKEGRLLEPQHDSAFGYYQEILQLDPQDNKARRGLSTVEMSYTGHVAKALADERLLETDQLISDGLKAFPNSPNLQSLRQKLSSKKIIAIDKLLGRAELNLAQNNLIKPENNCALKDYKEILILDPGNLQAKQGLSKIGDELTIQAELEYKEDNLKKANRIVDDGLEIVPKHKGLLELKKELSGIDTADRFADLADDAMDDGKLIKAQEYINKGLAESPHYRKLLTLKEKNTKKMEGDVNILVEEAQQRLAEMNFTTPEGDSALTYLNKIKEVDPENKILKKGYKEIGDHYANLADEAYRNFEMETCRKYVDQGLAIVPDHWRLLELKRDLSRSAPGRFFRGVGKNIGSRIDSLFEK